MFVHLPAIKGYQGGFEFYTVHVTMDGLLSSFVFDDTTLPVELRCQRELNKSRAAKFCEYIEENPQSFVTGAVIGTVNETAKFIPLDGPFSNGDIGVLRIPATERIVLCDGQHRQNGILMALNNEANEEFKNSHLPIILYVATSIQRKQQIFTDVNANTVKPSTSLVMTFDHRSNFISFVKDAAKSNTRVHNAIEWERSSVGSRSLRLWPLVSFKSFLCNLTRLSEANFDIQISEPDNRAILLEVVTKFLKGLDNLPLFADLLDRKVDVTEVRQTYIVGHAVFLEALGLYGAQLLQHFDRTGKADWDLMQALKEVPVDKTSWVGRCVTPQLTINKNQFGIKSTAAFICRMTNIPTSTAMDEAEARVAY